MRNTTILPIKDLADFQKETPDVFPIFGKVRIRNGEAVGEIIGYSDEFGNLIHLPESANFPIEDHVQ